MREFGRSSLSLAGSLLIAHPNLLDPNFRRTVLFISANDPQEGSFGLVLNRPAEKTVADLLPDRDLGVLGKVPVFIGGPILPNYRYRLDRTLFRTHTVRDLASEVARLGAAQVPPPLRALSRRLRDRARRQ